MDVTGPASADGCIDAAAPAEETAVPGTDVDSDDDSDDLTPPLPETTKGLDEDTEATEAEMPASSPRSFGCGECCKAPRGKIHAYDWLRDIPEPEKSKMVRVQFKNTRSGFYLNDLNLDLKPGDMVAVEANPGHDIGEVVMTGPLVRLMMRKGASRHETETRRIFRIARPADLEKYKEAMGREHDTMIRSRKIAEELGLNMKIGDVEYQGDGGKAIFYYIADERVDFRKLIRILADTFRIRVEMKQIGARQEAGRIGGIGPCGRPLCCSSWLSNFVSVGTSAARIQDISMNPQKLAGQCGKLKCCLNFEVDNYMEAGRKFPPKDAVLQTADGDFFQFKTDILKGEITYSSDKSVPANLVTIPVKRAFEIIALNKQGVKPEALATEKADDGTGAGTGFVNMVGQDSLTRFDKSKKKKKKKGKPAAEKEAKPQRQPEKKGEARAERKPDAPDQKEAPARNGAPKEQQKPRKNKNRQPKKPQTPEGDSSRQQGEARQPRPSKERQPRQPKQ